MAFEHQGSADNRVLNIQLKGKSPNPTAIGAKVTVQLDSGTVQTAEVHAGSGYLSQSTPTLTFGLGQSTAVKEVLVRWPGGSESQHAPNAGGLLVIEQR